MFLYFHDTATARLLRKESTGKYGVREFSPDRTRLSTRVAMLEWPSGVRVAGSDGAGAGFSPDGAWAFHNHNSVLSIHDARNGALIKPFRHSGFRARHFAFAPDMTTFAEPNHACELWLLSLQGHPWISTIYGEGEATQGEFSADGDHFIPSGEPRVIGPPLRNTRVYESRTAKPAGPDLIPGGDILNAAFSPGDSVVALLATAGRERTKDNMHRPDGHAGNAQFWDWRTGKRLSPVTPLPSEPRDVAFHPNGKWAVLVCSAGQVMKIDLATWRIETLFAEDFQNPGWPYSKVSTGFARFSEDGETLFVWGISRKVHVWDVKEKQHRFPPVEFPRYFPYGLDDHGDLFSVSASQDGGKGTGIRSMKTGEIVESPIFSGNGVWNLEFDETGKLLLQSRARDSANKIWNLETGQAHTPEWNALGPVVFVPKSPAVLTVGDPGFVRIWDRHSGKPLGPAIPVPHRTVEPETLRITSDGRWALFASEGLHRIDLSPLFQPHDMGLNEKDRRLLAELNAGAELVAGGLADVYRNSKWKQFHKRHPDFHSLHPRVEQRIDWHRMRAMEIRIQDGANPGDSRKWTMDWHERQAEELQTKVNRASREKAH